MNRLSLLKSLVYLNKYIELKGSDGQEKLALIRLDLPSLVSILLNFLTDTAVWTVLISY